MRSLDRSLLFGAGLALPCILAFTAPAQAHDRAGHRRAFLEVTEAAQVLLQTYPDEPGFIEDLFGYSQRERALLALEDKARTDWSYWPRARVGLTLGEMTKEQRGLLHELLAAILSSKGHLKVVQIMQLEEILRAQETTNFPRQVEDYSLIFFGPPSTEAPWALRFEGHHISLNVTLTPSAEIAVTPSFLGASPSVVPAGPLAGVRVLRLEEELARRLVRSLNENQRGFAIRSDEAPGEVFSSPFQKERHAWEEWKGTLHPDGLPASAMAGNQLSLLRELITEIVTTYRSDIADHVLDELDLSSLVFVWMGSTDPGEPHYYRIQGPTFVFEYDNVQGNARHIHSVWRDKDGDFGEKILRRHYEDAH